MWVFRTLTVLSWDSFKHLTPHETREHLLSWWPASSAETPLVALGHFDLRGGYFPRLSGHAPGASNECAQRHTGSHLLAGTQTQPFSFPSIPTGASRRMEFLPDKAPSSLSLCHPRVRSANVPLGAAPIGLSGQLGRF